MRRAITECHWGSVLSESMSGGLGRLEIEYRWPRQLLFEFPRHKTIYLDLNYWIGLAQAAVGHSRGERYEPLLQCASSLVQEKRAVFPLSAHHYMEMSGIADPRQRTDLANVMRDLSGYRTLVNLPLLLEIEVEAGISHILQNSSGYATPIQAIGTGFGHAFGIQGTFNIVDAHEDGAARERWPLGPEDFDAKQAEVQGRAEWMILRGPLDSDLEALSKSGYDPTVARLSLIHI